MTNRFFIVIVFASLICSCKPSKDNSLSLQIKQDSVEDKGISDYKISLISYDSAIAGAQLFDDRTLKMLKENKRNCLSIDYLSFFQLRDILLQRAKAEMWQPGRIDQELDSLMVKGRGGRVLLNVTSMADMGNTSIIIKDNSGTEVFRSSFTSVMSTSRMNAGHVYINKRLKTPFRIFIVEPFSNAPFEYKVESMTE